MHLYAPATNRPGPTLNAIATLPPETTADRTARHLRTCRELAELGMDVARPAAREAVSNLDAPVEHPMPGAHLPPKCPTADPGRLFTRVSHAVRQALALENCIAAGHLPIGQPRNATGEHRSAGQPPPHTRTGYPTFRLEVVEPLDDEFSSTRHRAIPEILSAILLTLGLTPDRDAAPCAVAQRHRPAPIASGSPHPSPTGPSVHRPRSRPPPRPG